MSWLLKLKLSWRAGVVQSGKHAITSMRPWVQTPRTHYCGLLFWRSFHRHAGFPSLPTKVSLPWSKTVGNHWNSVILYPNLFHLMRFSHCFPFPEFTYIILRFRPSWSWISVRAQFSHGFIIFLSGCPSLYLKKYQESPNKPLSSIQWRRNTIKVFLSLSLLGTVHWVQGEHLIPMGWFFVCSRIWDWTQSLMHIK